MLEVLRIRNFAIIESLELEFEGGLNAITGETGAGKSIILDAVSMILGARSDVSLVRAGSTEAVVETLFDVSKTPHIAEKLCAKGIDVRGSGGELLIKRVLQREGKNRIFVNGELVTLAQLIDISENLVDLCSQHEHQSLAKPSYQLDLLDRFGGLIETRRKVREIYSALRSKQNELSRLLGDDSDTARREDFLRFQIQEIDAFGLRDGEEEILTQERRTLTGVTLLLEACAAAGNAVAGGDDTDARSLVQKALKRLTKACDTDPALAPAVESLTRCMMELDECASMVTRYAENLNSDPARLDEVEERLSRLVQMKKKYGDDFASMTNARERLGQQLEALEGTKTRLHAIGTEINTVRTAYSEAAQSLSKKRRTVAKALTSSIQGELDELKMTGARFKAEFEPTQAADETRWSPDGIDHMEFLFAPNVGEGFKPLGKIASGGELSRVMLAVRRVVSDQGGICVYLFDEIDAGIGGQTAAVVGKKIKSVAQHNQVICITHLAQIAAFADAHFNVSKSVADGRTFSTITRLTEKNRVDETARMLGGIDVTTKSRDHARELIKQAQAE